MCRCSCIEHLFVFFNGNSHEFTINYMGNLRKLFTNLFILAVFINTSCVMFFNKLKIESLKLKSENPTFFRIFALL